MKSFVISALVGAALVSLPAAAQTVPARSISQREARLAEHIDESADRQEIDQLEASRLRRDLKRIQRLDHYYRRSNGLSAWERRDLERRLKALNGRLTAARRAAAHAHRASSEKASAKSS